MGDEGGLGRGSLAALPCTPGGGVGVARRLHLGSVASIFPAAVSQGAQDGHAFGQGQQAVGWEEEEAECGVELAEQAEAAQAG